jgi:hypothetical protein
MLQQYDSDYLLARCLVTRNGCNMGPPLASEFGTIWLHPVVGEEPSVKQDQSSDRKQVVGKLRLNPVRYTPEPWHILEQTPGDAWMVVGEPSTHGARALATIHDAVSDLEQQANARLIASAPSMHCAAVKLLCAWGTEDAPEAMEELAVILSQAV